MVAKREFIRPITILVCFEGKNRRIGIDPDECTINKRTKDFSCKITYKADNDKIYLLNIKSIKGTEGKKCDVRITDKSGAFCVAERCNVNVSFSRYLFERA